jgi:hypothetical protein
VNEIEIALLASIARNSTKNFWEALEEIKAQAWDEGCAEGYRADRMSLIYPTNPYRTKT